MSAQPEVAPAVNTAGGGLACPRCSAPVAKAQSWCLTCGAAARTALAHPPNWRLPAALLATLAVLAVMALIGAFVIATNDDEPLVRTAPSAPVEPPTP